jgi:hypothetical protein
MIFYLGLFLLLLGYLLYIQFSPGMGNIWYRNGEYFSPMGAVNVIFYPLYSVEMWRFEMWDLNFFIWILSFICVYYLYFGIYDL